MHQMFWMVACEMFRTLKCSDGYQSSIEHLLTTPDPIILGDFNAHHPSGYSRTTDTRGKRMDDSINGYDYGILTRVPPNAEPSSTDVSLASTSLITSCSLQTLPTLSSNHLQILIRLQMKTTTTPGLRRTYVNLKKANWDIYRQEMEAALSKRSFPTDCQRDLPYSSTQSSVTPHPYWTTQTPRETSTNRYWM